jgi:ribosomal protein S18 acetylase RimI-like enzyme
MPEITRRATEPGDEAFLYALYCSTRESEMALTGWSEDEKESFLRMQFHAQTTDYARNYADAQFDLLLCEGEPAGRLYLDRREDEIRIVDIALMPAFRNRGIGSELLAEVMAEAEESGKTVTIHVEVNNPAMSLYNRLGFKPVGEHGVYLLMERKPEMAVA